MIRLVHPNNAPVKLRWTDQHAASSYGLGVMLRGHGGEVFDGATFAGMAADGWRIECSTDLERRRVAGALAWAALGLSPDVLRVTEGKTL